MTGRTETDKFIELPAGFGAGDYENRGPNDCEVRYKPRREHIYNEKGAENNG